MPAYPTPTPLIDTLAEAKQQIIDDRIKNPDDFAEALDFLEVYQGNSATFEAYRRELERLLQWAWLIKKKSILTLERSDIEDFIQFCLKPPKKWIGTKSTPRFIEADGIRAPNPNWRPFVVRVNKKDFKQGEKPDKSNYKMSTSSIRALFAILGRFYEHLLLEEKVNRNPVALIRQKSRYLQKNQQQSQIIRLSDKQWQMCMSVAEQLAAENPLMHERTLFIITAMYLMYLRISEFSANEYWTPAMNHFYRDSHQQWWFKTIGKGRKLRTIAVSDAMLDALTRYREKLSLSPLPSPNEQTPLIPKLRGNGPMRNTRQIRRLIQTCFDHAVTALREKNHHDEADSLESATVHWLRHTGISDDVNKRGRAIMHVKDDAGHASIQTTGSYSDVELKDRHQSAKHKSVDISKENHKT